MYLMSTLADWLWLGPPVGKCIDIHHGNYCLSIDNKSCTDSKCNEMHRDTVREVGVKCCVAQSLNASPICVVCIQHKAAQQTPQGMTILLQEPRPGLHSVMQAHNSQQALDKGRGLRM